MPLKNYNTSGSLWNVPENYDVKAGMKDLVKALNPMMAVPYYAEDVYSGATGGDYLKAGGGLLGLLGAGSMVAPSLAAPYARATMPLRNVNVNIEATSPNILQKANETGLGQTLSDARFRQALTGAQSKGMSMANAPYAKTQGVWVDPASNVEEFNRVYSQNVGRLGMSPIQQNPALTNYAMSMGGDLGQWGVGASRFSPLPANLAKESANAVKFNNVKPQDIIAAGTKLNPKGGVVSATPDGGMVVFDTSGTMTATDIAKQLKSISSKPKYGLLDSAYFDTSGQAQGQYMTEIDKLIKGFGY